MGEKLSVFIEANVEKVNQNRVTNPIHHSRFQILEKALNDLFLKELNSDDSIFIKISPNVVKKIAMFMSGLTFRPAAIGICGETACGKSTIVQDSICVIDEFSAKCLKNQMVTRINTDDYYHDRSKEVEAAGSFAEFVKNYDLDVPEAIELCLMKEHITMLLNHQEVHLPKYDMSGSAKRFNNHRLVKPSPVVLAEGLFTLTDGVGDIFDFKIYVDIDREVQKKRFFERAKQRDLGDSAHQIYANAVEKAQVYVHPCQENADIILNGEVSREKYRQFISSMLLLIESEVEEKLKFFS